MVSVIVCSGVIPSRDSSFALNPAQLHLDSNIESFLKDHAIGLLNNNKNLRMGIHAYATPIDNKDFSDIRLSLARALEVRSFLIQHGTDPSRLKLTPMGADEKNNSDDRIDLLLISAE